MHMVVRTLKAIYETNNDLSSAVHRVLYLSIAKTGSTFNFGVNTRQLPSRSFCRGCNLRPQRCSCPTCICHPSFRCHHRLCCCSNDDPICAVDVLASTSKKLKKQHGKTLSSSMGLLSNDRLVLQNKLRQPPGLPTRTEPYTRGARRCSKTFTGFSADTGPQWSLW